MGRPRKRRRDVDIDTQLGDESNEPLGFGALNDALQYDFSELLGLRGTLDALPNPEGVISANGQYVDTFNEFGYMPTPDFSNAHVPLQQVDFGSNLETRYGRQADFTS